MRIIELLSSRDFGTEALVKGWVRTKRGNKSIVFVAVNDGSVIHNIQVVFDMSRFDEKGNYGILYSSDRQTDRVSREGTAC